MVLASNEWHNFCENDQKSVNTTTTTTTATTSNTTDTTTAVATTSTATTSAAPTATAATPQHSTAATGAVVAAAASSATATEITNSISISPTTHTVQAFVNNANNEQFTDSKLQKQIVQQHQQNLQLQSHIQQETQIPAVQQQQQNIVQQQQAKPPPPKYEEVLLFNSNNLKIMSENTNATLKTEMDSTNAADPIDIVENNNRSFSNELHANYLNDTINDSSLANFNSNSDSNTVQAAAASCLLRPSLKSDSTSTMSHSPISSQALSSALQSVISATTIANSGGGGGGQNNFLSSLGIGMTANSTLQQTTKQLNSFYVPATLEAQTNLANANNSTNLSLVGASSDHVNVELATGQAKIMLLCEANSHPFQTRSIFLTPNIECKVGRLIAKSKASESNAIFDCKVLSRNHAVLWYSDDGKFWVKDTKSSNGTFINDNKLGNEAAELHFGDIVKFGVDVLENSRKEVHGCIIAFVKIYLPDGREAVSIDSTSPRSQHSGDGRISYEELHRLNLYMQEAAQREKVLKSKLFNLQNLLDATRKNSALCWQSMIAEDQLLHRINSLEKKLQIMEKNAPESVLRNEVLKLLDDKSSYQHTAKEALHKVYQERCDAMQKLAKMEATFASSDNECKILRDQIMNSKQSLQDVNSRLLRLETEYNEYKEESDRQQQEAKELEQQRLTELTEKLRQYEQECEELRHKVSELLLKRAEHLYDDEQQAIEKLDAAIADMELGDDDENVDNDEVDDDEVNNDSEGDEENANMHADRKAPGDRVAKKRRKKSKSQNNSVELSGVSVVDTSSSSGGSEKEKTSSAAAKFEDTSPLDNRRKCQKESTIMKWLQNSDLNKTDGSLDIFKAICNESDSSDELTSPLTENATGGDAKNHKAKKRSEDFERKCTKFTSKLQCVRRNLRQLEADFASETDKAKNVTADLDDDSSMANNENDEEAAADTSDGDGETDASAVAVEVAAELIVNRADTLGSPLSKDNKRYYLLKRSVCMLREAYNEICDNMKQQQELQQSHAAPGSCKSVPQSANSVQTKFQSYAQHKSSNSAAEKLETHDTLKLVSKQNEEHDSEEDDDDEEEEDLSDSTTTARLPTISPHRTKETEAEEAAVAALQQQKYEMECKLHEYQMQVEQLNKKLAQNENDTQNTLEIMQFECDTFKDKVSQLSMLVASLSEDKNILERVVLSSQEQNKSAAESQANIHIETATQSHATPNASVPGVAFEREVCEELAAINCNNMQREEELIMYKERLELTQNDNLQLRNEIKELRLITEQNTKMLLLKRLIPYGAAAVAIVAYLLSTYL